MPLDGAIGEVDSEEADTTVSVPPPSLFEQAGHQLLAMSRCQIRQRQGRFDRGMSVESSSAPAVVTAAVDIIEAVQATKRWSRRNAKMHRNSKFMRAATVAVLAMMTLVSTALAQVGDTETITVTVQGAAAWQCNPSGYTMGVTADATDGPDYPIIVPEGGTDSNNPWVNFRLTVQYAGCSEWNITAQLDDFELTTDSTETFPASTFVLSKSGDPTRWNPSPLPEWMEGMPDDLDIGLPVAPDTITFVESNPAATAAGSGPLLSSSSASYGTPGNSTGYYQMKLTGVPSDQTPGDYTSTITVSMSGGD